MADASATTSPEVPDSEPGAPPDRMVATGAGLDRPRPSVSYLEPVAWADPPTHGFTADPADPE